MKKWFFVLISCTLFLFLHTGAAFADGISGVSAAIDGGTRQVTVSGTIGSGAGQVVNIRVTDPEGGLDYLDTNVSGSDGHFLFTYLMTNTKTGRYSVRVSALGVESPVETSFTYGTGCELTALSLSSGSFDSTFSPSDMEYTASVESTIDSVTVTPVAADKTAIIKVNGADTASGSPSESIALESGSNTLRVTVTALSGAVKAYTVTVLKAALPASADLSASASIDADRRVKISGLLSTGTGQLVSIRTTAPDGSLEYAGVAVSEGGGAFALSYDLNSETKGRYLVNVGAFGAAASTQTYFDYGVDANLSGLTLSSGTLSPAFDASITEYTVKVGNDVSSFTVTPVAKDPGAVIKVNGAALTASGTSGVLTLVSGENPIKIAVTAKDGLTTKTYSVIVNKSTVPTGFSVSAEIDSDQLVSISGTAPVGQQLISVKVKDPAGKIDYLDTKVCAKDGAFSFTYTLTNTTFGKYEVILGYLGLEKSITTYFLYEQSANANLSALAVTGWDLETAFDPEQTSYTAYVSNATTKATVTATAADTSYATVSINGKSPVVGKSSASVTLNTGNNTVQILVTAQDGTAKTYTLTLIRISDNANLRSLELSAGTIAFKPATLTYVVEVQNSVGSTTITPTVADSSATVKVNGISVESGSSSKVALKVGYNKIPVVVTAQNGTIKTYYVVITRLNVIAVYTTPATTSSSSSTAGNNNLGNLTISSGSLSPAFASGTTVYTALLPNTSATVTITPTVDVYGATVTVDGTAVVSGNPSEELALAVGVPRTVNVIVTAKNGTTKTYTITLTRAANDASLSNLAVGDYTLSPAFATATLNYTLAEGDLDHTITGIAVTPTVTDANATVKIGGVTVTSGTARTVSLAVGSNAINIVVTAQDGTTTRTYKITAVREADPTASDNADLSDLVLTDETAFFTYFDDYTSATTGYAVTIDGVNRQFVKVTATAAQANATITVSGAAVNSGTPSDTFSLNLGGTTTIPIVVTAEDDLTTKTYQFVIHHRYDTAVLSDLTVSEGILAYTPVTTAYAITVGTSTGAIDVTPTAGFNGTITIATDTEPDVSVDSGDAVSVDLNAAGGADTVITITVTSQDTAYEKVYQITVHRPAT